MKLKYILANIFSLVIYLNITTVQAGVVDFSQCGTNSSFSIFTQSEGPTDICGAVNTSVGNPINVLNGNKFEAVNDFKELPAFQGLSFSRYYNSQSNARTAMGYGWYSSFDIKLYEQPDIIQIRLETGQRLNFKKTKINIANGQFVMRALPQNPNDGWIEKKIDGSGWLWHKTQTAQDYLFQSLGVKDPNLAHLTRISSNLAIYKNNPSLNFSFQYDQQQRLAWVKNGKGDQLAFQYSTTQAGLAKIIMSTPIGKYYYFLDQNNNLAQVLYPDGKRLKYSYDPKFQGGDIHNLTAKWFFDSTQNKFNLISEWHYDQQDRAILSQHANGVEKVSIEFDSRTHKNMPANYTAASPTYKNIVTNSLGKKTNYSYQVVGTNFRLLESLGAGCASCGEVNKRYRFNPQGLVSYAADLDAKGQIIRALDLKYNEYGAVTSKTLSAVGVKTQTTYYEYESYQTDPTRLITQNSRLDQLEKQDFHRLKTEYRASVVTGQQYRKVYNYDQYNQLIAVKETGYSPLGDHLTRETQYGYDAQGRLIWEDGPLPNGKNNSPQDSDIRSYHYNDAGQLQQLNMSQDQQVQVLKFDHLQRPELVKIMDGKRSIEVDLSYHGNGLLVAEYVYHIGDNTPHRIENTYNLQDQLIATKNDQQEVSFVYDLIGRLVKSSQKNGLEITQDYNSESFITEKVVMDSSGQLLNRIHNQLTIDPTQTTLSVSDELGLLQSSQQSGLALKQQDALKRIFTQQFDGLGRQIQSQIISPSQQRVAETTEHYQTGYAQQSTAGLQQQKWMDDFGRTVVTQTPAIGIKLYHFNAANLPTEMIDENGLIQKYQYDASGRLISTSLKNPSNAHEVITRKMYYDGSKMLKQISPDELQTWDYRQDGKLLRHQTTQLEANNPTHHQAGAQKVSFQNPVQAQNLITQPQLLVQIEAQLSGEKQTNQHDLQFYSWSEDYEYDQQGLLSKEQRRDLSIAYTRDEAGKITALSLDKNGEKTTVDQIEWSSIGQLSHYRLGSGQQLWRSYDSRGRLTQQRWYNPVQHSFFGRLIDQFKYQLLGFDLPEAQIQTSNYVYDQANRLVYSNAAGRQYYQYDDQDQLLAVWKSTAQPQLKQSWSPAQVYAYDAQGNRRLQWQKSEKNQDEIVNLYRYGTQGDASVQLLGVSQHIVNKGEIQTGQLTRVAAYTQTGQPLAWWQAQPEIKTVLDYVPSAKVGAPVWNTAASNWHGIDDQNKNIDMSQQLNQQGMLASRSVTFNTPHQPRRFSQHNGYVDGIRVWEQQRISMPDEQHLDINDAEQQQIVVDRDYVMLAGLPILQFSQISLQQQDELKAVSGAFNAVQFNHIGAPIKVFDEENNIRWQTEYSPFGERLNTVSSHDENAQLIRVAKNLPLSQSVDDLRYAISIRLPGQNEDPITGLYDNGHRQYDPSTGRYLTPDPMGTVDGLNPYLYVGNDPLNKIDPYGLYQTDMHYYVTYFLAIAAGIDSDNARRIALGAQFIDTNDNTSPYDDEAGAMVSLYKNFTTERLEYYHFANNRFFYEDPLNGMELGSWDLKKPQGMSDAEYQSWRLTSNLNNIPQLKNLTSNYKHAAKCNNLNLSMQFFGEYLHAFEDTFAHRDQDNDPFGVNAGAGHAVYGSNPDFTYNHHADFELPGNVVGFGEWTVNEKRAITEQQQVYLKLVEYRETILKIPASQTKVVPWDELKNYLRIYNATPENLDPEHDQGSLDSVIDKVRFLQNLLNGTAGNQAIYTFNAQSNENETHSSYSYQTHWGYQNKDGSVFQLWRELDDAPGHYGAGKDGYSIPQAISNRIDVFKNLTDTQMKQYKNVIWDTSVEQYKSKDPGERDLVKLVQNYRLSTIGVIKKIFGNQNSFVIKGTPPVAAQK